VRAAADEKELEEVAKVLNSEAVREAEKAVDALLNLEPSSSMGATGRLIAKISVITLSVAAVIFLSWVSEWNPVIILSSVVLFSLPVWQVLRRL